ncbi:MAG TPA: acyl-CoA dehydrogenase [Leeuwenhoekiella sp.]|nr:acyl-CoA dehydrogenase [Leeuwenhoekiella sp.]
MNQTTLQNQQLDWKANAEAEFPHNAFETLHQTGYLKKNVPIAYGGCSWGLQQKTPQLLQLLTQVGRKDLSVGRLYEGHVNALYLIYLYGSAAQQEQYFQEALDGKRFGIWNTDEPKNPVKLVKNGSHYELFGTKRYCSGGLHMHRPIITAATDQGPQMVIIHTEELDESREDASGWNPLGMKASHSVTIDFSTYCPKPVQLLGAPQDYSIQPYFSTGAVRFAAVQLGGAEALAQCAFAHLKTHKRDSDPHQLARMGKMAIALETGRNWLRETGRVLDSSIYSENDKINHANMVRTAILDLCTEIMHLAEKCVGLAGMMEDHAMHKLHRDLATYLKQPGPDRALTSVGEWVAQTTDTLNTYN